MADRLHRAHLLCCRGTSCSSGGSASIFDTLGIEIKNAGLEKEVELVMTGCHGLCELGPIMVLYPDDLLYCQVRVEDIPEIVNETLIKGRPVERLLYKDPSTAESVPHYHQIPFYANQVRIALRNCGFINPEKIEEYIARDGYAALEKVLSSMTPEQVIDEVLASGLRGRGGAGFPTGLKWRFTRNAPGDVKYLICNADEGDPGAFMDRSLIEGDPHSLLEGMLIAGYAIGSQKGYVYCRAEYPLAIERLKLAIKQAMEYGLLGQDILGTGHNFELEIKEGAGAFVCGEETALIASIEERRGEPRPRPPFPANSGLWGKPTNINNVKSYANIPQIMLRGAEWFASMGTENSKGTAIFALTGKVNNTGLVEVPMGITVGEIVFDIGGGIARGKKFKAIQTGGPLGGCIPVEQLNTPVDYDSLRAAGAIMGSGGMIVMDEDTCMVELAKFFLQFSTKESCGQCTPCRVGGQKLLDILTRITEGKGKLSDLDMLEDISKVMSEGSLCALGQLTPSPVLTTLRAFRDEFLAHILDKRCPAGTCEELVPAPCRNACPAGVDVPLYVSLIAEGRYDEALTVHREVNPFPAICGRICPAFCERRCRRGELDEALAVRHLKRFMAEQETHFWKPEMLEEAKEESVGIVGGGPAGLTAALRLGQLGYKVTIYEAMPRLGGMMAYGIPDYRLPAHTLQQEIDSILSLDNVEARTGVRIGEDVTLDELKRTHNAVFLGLGATKGAKLNIPGESSEGVVSGVDFLRRVNLGESMPEYAGKRVAVIGGGDVVIDVSRSLLRLGAKEVHIIYRRRYEDMPAYPDEIEAAVHEGVQFHYLLAPLEILNDGGKTIGLRCQRLKLENDEKRPVFDTSARKQPFPVEESQFTLDLDMVIPAIGQVSATDSVIASESAIQLGRNNTIVTDERTLATNEPGVFAGGDAALGAATVVQAIAQGNRAAQAIHLYLQGDGDLCMPAEVLEPTWVDAPWEMDQEDANRPRRKASILAPEVRTSDFREVELGFPDEGMARLEARRCLRCDRRHRPLTGGED